LLSNLNVTTQANESRSQLTVDFDILEPWTNDPLYVVNYTVMIQNTDTGSSASFTTQPVNSQEFLVSDKY